QLYGTDLRIGYYIGLSVPLVGTWVAFLLFGGEFPSPETIHRLFVAHIFIVPAALAGLIAAHLAIIWRQKHTQFAAPGRTETNVVGSKLWPTYTAKSVGLLFGVAAVLAAMGGLLQINPVWLYGPFDPAAVSSPGQPDWYLGWIEGALRVFPGWELRAFGFVVPNPFFPAVLLPTVTFLILYAWPFLERRLTGDTSEHHLLDRPRDHPVRTAIGIGGLGFFLVLVAAGSNDVLAKIAGVSVGAITWAFRILAVTLPFVLGLATWWWLRAAGRTAHRDPFEVPLSALVPAA